MVRLRVVAQGKARWKGEQAVTEPVTATFVTEGVKEAPKLLDYIWESKTVRNARWEAILAKLREL
jgi:hypothetical protein